MRSLDFIKETGREQYKDPYSAEFEEFQDTAKERFRKQGVAGLHKFMKDKFGPNVGSFEDFVNDWDTWKSEADYPEEAFEDFVSFYYETYYVANQQKIKSKYNKNILKAEVGGGAGAGGSGAGAGGNGGSGSATGSADSGSSGDSSSADSGASDSDSGENSLPATPKSQTRSNYFIGMFGGYAPYKKDKKKKKKKKASIGKSGIYPESVIKLDDYR